MPDIWTAQKRSQVMARIRSRSNKSTELRLATLLRQAGITGWRRNQKLHGRPDFVFRKPKLAIFVDGCFWHCCPKHGNQPISHRPYWAKKLAGNKARDRRITSALRQAGWKVLRIWEHDLTTFPEKTLNRVRSALLPASSGRQVTQGR